MWALNFCNELSSDRILIAEEIQLELRTHSWQPIATAPEQKDLEVRLEDALGRYELLFPCRLLPEGRWINSWLQTPLLATPVEWREWVAKGPRVLV
jgi:hypothetical protein